MTAFYYKDKVLRSIRVIVDHKLAQDPKSLFVSNRGATFVARRVPIEGARPIPHTLWSLVSINELKPNNSQGYCPELSMAIWSTSTDIGQSRETSSLG